MEKQNNGQREDGKLMLELDNIYNMDCLEGMKQIPDGTIDAVICDLYDKGYTVSFVLIQISVETLNQRRN